MRVKIQDAPLELRRRVANKLESIRGTEMAPGADGAQLGPEACPVYRLDMKEIAYWEFEITGVKSVQPRDHKGKSSGAGFMLASTGSHDIPIPHWSLTKEAPSRALESKSKAKVARVVKLDTLAYTGEDEKGNYLSHVGQLPINFGLSEADMAKYKGITTVTAAPSKPSASDKTKSELVVRTEGVAIPKLKPVPFDSYAGFKKGFVKAYSPFLKALAGRAAEFWNIENLITKNGEGIHEGQLMTVPLLSAGKVKVTGDGTKLVKLTVLKRTPAAVTLEVLPSAEKKEAGIQLEISYENGGSEKLPYFIIPKGTPSNNRSVLPKF